MIAKRTRKQLEATIRKAHTELSAIKSAEDAKQSKKLLGRFFKFENSYSSEDKWWLYLRIVGIEDDTLIGHDFQTDCHGQVMIEPRKSIWAPSGILERYTEIDSAEFYAAWCCVIENLNKL